MISLNDFDDAKSLEVFFINYLNIKGIHFIYISNFKESHLQPYSFSDFVKDLYNNKNIRALFSGAFTWSETKQGHDFWSQQNMEFVNYIRTSEILANYWED